MMSSKSAPMAAFLEDFAGRSTAQQARRCIPAPLGCGRDVSDEELKAADDLTQREYIISGWCPTCQLEVFGP